MYVGAADAELDTACCARPEACNQLNLVCLVLQLLHVESCLSWFTLKQAKAAV